MPTADPKPSVRQEIEALRQSAMNDGGWLDVEEAERLFALALRLAEQVEALQAQMDADDSERKSFDILLWGKLNVAADAIKAHDKWPITSWPSPVERAWYAAAQERIADLEAKVEALTKERPAPCSCGHLDGCVNVERR